ncbi:MAG TPA: hypothetical protein VGI77_07030 [Gaiellaceae bacterium]
MKRVLLVILALAAVAPATAKATVPCRDRIYNDWYADGKIGTTYPIACYRDALTHVKGRSDILEYSSMADDIRAALQGALARSKGDTKVPTQIGDSGPAVKPLSEHRVTDSTPPHDPAPGPEQVNTTLPTPSTVAAGATKGSGGLPMPLLVLGGLALLLTAVGGIGVVAKRRRN